MSKTEHVLIYVVLFVGMAAMLWLGYSMQPPPIIDCGL